jgi:predicted RNase H-like HicB family nuclease
MKHKTILNYQAVFQKEPTGGYAVWIPELPGCASQGNTLDEAKSNIEEAIQLYLEDAPDDVVREARSPREQFFVPISISFVYG